MLKHVRWVKTLGLAASLLYSQHGVAAVLNSMSVPIGETKDVMANDQVITTTYSNVAGTLNNYGSIAATSVYMDGTIDNHGRIHANGAPFTLGIGNVLNHADGQIYLFGWLDLLSDQALFENEGTLVMGPAYGAGAQVIRNFMGTVKNTGTMRFDRHGSVCGNSGPGAGNFVNEGSFEITKDTVCDFLGGTMGEVVYTQNAGETEVNGTLGFDQIQINKGRLSGNGTLHGGQINPTAVNNPFSGLGRNVTIAPGAPVGTLSIVSDETYLRCDGCTIDIELAGANQSDQLKVEGEFDVVRWTLNVSLRDGYIPAPGAQFNVVAANMMVYGNPALTTYNLPKLPDGRTWSVDTTGTGIILTAN